MRLTQGELRRSSWKIAGKGRFYVSESDFRPARPDLGQLRRDGGHKTAKIQVACRYVSLESEDWTTALSWPGQRRATSVIAGRKQISRSRARREGERS